jgi:hypothetical protein
MVTAAVLLGTGVAVADVYLNFQLTCNGNGGSDKCRSGSVIFQGSIDVADPAKCTSKSPCTGTVIPASATVFLNGGAYTSTGVPATGLGTNSAEVTYTCDDGQCRIQSVSLGVQTANNGTYYFQSNGKGDSSSISAYNATVRGSQWSLNDQFSNSIKTECFKAKDGGCALADGPLHHPEINGATLPKAALLLGSLFLFIRERKRAA